jgi:hypothetical protein
MTHGDDDKPDRVQERILLSVSDSDPLVGAPWPYGWGESGAIAVARENEALTAEEG